MIGLDLLGLGSPHWNIDQTIAAIKSYPGDLAIGAFDAGWPHCFGDPRAHLTRIIAQCSNVKAIRIQGWWSPQHKLVPSEVTAHRAPIWQAFAQSHPVKVYYSFSCEYSEPNLGEIQKRVSAVKVLAPSVIPVCCPMGGSPSVAGEVSEEHGKNATAGPNQIASFDGNATYDCDAESWFRRSASALIEFAWGFRCNGAEAHNTLPPDKRTAFPDVRYLKALLRLTQPKGTEPVKTFPGHAAPFKRPLLLKSHGEDLQGSNPRDDKPLIIVDAKAPFAEVLTYDGKMIGKFPYFAGYPPNLHRYYAGLSGMGYGYEIGAKAKEVSGSEFVWFKVGNHLYGGANPAFRTGYFGS